MSSGGRHNAGLSKMLMMQALMAQQQTNLLNQAIRQAAINPMDDNRRQNLQTSLNNAAAAKTAAESSFKNGTIDSGLGTLQSELSASVDPHAADRKNPDAQSSNGQQGQTLLDQLRNGNTGGGALGANVSGPSAQNVAGSSPLALSGSALGSDLKALQEISKSQTSTDAKTTEASAQSISASGAALGAASKLAELQSVLASAGEKKGKNASGHNGNAIADRNPTGVKDGEAGNADAASKGALAQVQNHDSEANRKNSLSERLSGFLMRAENGDGGRVAEIVSPIARFFNWSGLLGKTPEKIKGKHHSLYRHYDQSAGVLVIPLSFMIVLFWVIVAFRTSKRRGVRRGKKQPA